MLSEMNCAHCRADRRGMLNHHNRPHVCCDAGDPGRLAEGLYWASSAYPARGFRAWADDDADPDPDPDPEPAPDSNRCPDCDGGGLAIEGWDCPACDGSGRIC